MTEIGSLTKNFIDCGGTIRRKQSVSLQIWDARDVNHRLRPEKLLHIIRLSEEQLGIADAEIEVEYQGETIGKYGLDFNGRHFVLTNKQTACLATDACGTAAGKSKRKLEDLNKSYCAPDTGCCQLSCRLKGCRSIIGQAGPCLTVVYEGFVATIEYDVNVCIILRKIRRDIAVA